LLGAHKDAFFMHPWRLSVLFWRDPIDNGQMIDLAITRCKVNATKKIREFCLIGTISSE
jgi:hypothetical protein